MCGSEAARAYFRMIDRAREANGMSMEEIRAMQMTTEHCTLIGQQPDIIQKLKDYGIILSCGPDLISEAPKWIADYGPQIEPFILPIKTWIESGLNVVGQNTGGPGPFHSEWLLMRRAFRGYIWAPEESIDRVRALKLYTSWAGRYVTKSDQLGTLEDPPGH